MWLVFSAFVIGAVLRIAKPYWHDERALLRDLAETCRARMHVVFAAGLVIILGVLAFLCAPVTSIGFVLGFYVWSFLVGLPVFLFAIVIAFFTTDFLILHRRSEKALIPAAILGAGGLAVVAAQVFPGDEIKRAISAVDTPIGKVTFNSTPPAAPVHATLLTTAPNGGSGEMTTSDAVVAGTRLVWNARTHLESLRYLARYISDDLDAHKTHHIPSTRHLDFIYEAILKKTAGCSMLIRGSSLTSDQEFMLSGEFLAALRNLLRHAYQPEAQPLPKPAGSARTFVPALGANLRHVSELFRLFHGMKRLPAGVGPDEAAACLDLPRLLDDESVPKAIFTLIPSDGPDAVLREAVRESALLPVVVAGVLAQSNLRRDAVDELVFWAHVTRERIGRTYPRHLIHAGSSAPAPVSRQTWDAYRRLSSVYVLNWAAILNDVAESPTLELLATREAVREFEALASSNIKLRQIVSDATSQTGTAFSVDGECAAFLDENKKILPDAEVGAISLALRNYFSNVNNFIYWNLIESPSSLDEERIQAIDRLIGILYKLDYDCLTRDEQLARHISIYFADTYVTAVLSEMAGARQSAPIDHSVLRRTACGLAAIRDTLHGITKDYQRLAGDLPPGPGIRMSLGEIIAADRTRRDYHEVVDTGRSTVDRIDRVMAQVAGNAFHTAGNVALAEVFSAIGFRTAYADVCAA